MPLEIERKWWIEPCDPSASPLADARRASFVQTYLVAEPGSSQRVRRVAEGSVVRYFHTVKRAVVAGVREEDEREVSAAAYEALVAQADPSRLPILKTRWTFAHGGLVWEVDCLTSPVALWLMEVELADAALLDAELDLPPGVRVRREVTAEPGWSNSDMARPGWAPGA